MTKDGDQDIYLVSSTGQMIQKFGVGSGSSISVSPDWSPDGRKFAYVSNESGNPQIYIFDVTTGQKKRVTFSGKYNTSPVLVAQRRLYRLQRRGGRRIQYPYYQTGRQWKPCAHERRQE